MEDKKYDIVVPDVFISEDEKPDEREGIKVDKGVILTAQRVEKNFELYSKYLTMFTAYPDLFIDLITPKESNFKLFPYQRVFLRSCLRFRYHYCTAPRAFSKSFVSILAKYLTCVFLPRSKQFICAPGKEQGTKIAKDNISTIWNEFPLLKKELIGDGESGTVGINFSSDLVRLAFKNGSIFDIVAAQDAQRGGRRSGGIVDEVRDHDGDMLNSVVLPLMNVNRRTMSGIVNQNEPHQSQTYITSAGNKGTYAYERMIELFINQIINPMYYFVWGCDYRIPVSAGLLSKAYVRDQKMSSTYDNDDFAREYMSIWTGGSKDSWISYDMMKKYRVIVNSEKKAHFNEVFRESESSFYLMSVDVARLKAQTVISVIKVSCRDGNRFIGRLVNINVLSEALHFEHQAAIIKEWSELYNPKEISIDGTGLGVGLMDYMIQYNTHPTNGLIYEPYGSMNDKDYISKQPKTAKRIVYVIKADPTFNGAVYANLFSCISTGRALFLITDQEAKVRLMATKVGKKLSEEEKSNRIKPYKLTSILQAELANLRIKDGSVNQKNISIETINRSIGKDKVSSLGYGLFRMKIYEEEYVKKMTRRTRSRVDMMQYSKGGEKKYE